MGWWWNWATSAAPSEENHISTGIGWPSSSRFAQMEWKGRMERKSWRERQTGQRHWHWIRRDGCTIIQVRGYVYYLCLLFFVVFPLILCVPRWLSQWQCTSLLPLVRDFRWMNILFSVRFDLFFIRMQNNAWAYIRYVADLSSPG